MAGNKDCFEKPADNVTVGIKIRGLTKVDKSDYIYYYLKSLNWHLVLLFYLLVIINFLSVIFECQNPV